MISQSVKNAIFRLLNGNQQFPASVLDFLADVVDFHLSVLQLGLEVIHFAVEFVPANKDH